MRAQADPNRARPLWVFAFDLMLGSLFLWAFVVGLRSLHAPDSEATEGNRLVGLTACCFDAGCAFALVSAGVLLLRRHRWAALFQRAVFWALLLRCGLVVMEFSLPSEGGVGGFLILIGLPALVILTFTAFIGAVAVRRLDN